MEHGNAKFYMPFRPETCSEKLEIPKWFKWLWGDFVDVIPTEVILRNRLMNTWRVGITKIGESLYFKNGWANFVADNSIKTGDYMVFRFDGYGPFEVLVLGVDDLTDWDKAIIRMDEEDEETQTQGERKTI
ncbi:PREDICTED: B3 domain-containing protein REM21-like [Ipomoea nil]|uniref:B3 domain-containing protein REM21-like n=1 Tax=Ipomoea nil TaxID=35883 RepID=UPI0009018AD5|nr:PREDICTED: B3 domain-containing protein REM21-like [Ipomoea nil]